MKKIISILLSAVLLTSCIGLNAGAAATGQKTYSEQDGYVIIDHVVYEKDENLYPGTYQVVSLFDTAEAAKTVTAVNVVGEIEGIPVKSMLMYHPWENYAVKSIVLPDSIAYIGSPSAQEPPFAGFANLETVNIPKNLEKLGACAFSGLNKLKGKITLPESLTSVGERAFQGCNSLKEVTFKSKKLTYISDHCFSGCTKLSEINFNGKLLSIGDSAFSECTSLKSFKLPSTLTEIGSEAFSNSGITKVTIPSSVTKPRGKTNVGHNIGDGAFSNCKNLKTVVIKGGKSNNIYLDNTFYGCTKLKSVTFPKYAKSITISDGAFSNCKNLKKITFNKKKTAPKIKLFKQLAVSGRQPVETKPFKNTKSGIKLYVKDKKVAKQLKKNLKGSGVKKAKIYVGKKLIYKNVK